MYIVNWQILFKWFHSNLAGVIVIVEKYAQLSVRRLYVLRFGWFWMNHFVVVLRERMSEGGNRERSFNSLRPNEMFRGKNARAARKQCGCDSKQARGSCDPYQLSSPDGLPRKVPGVAQ